MVSRTPIGGLLLEAAEGWSFSLRDGVIAGKRGKSPGVLQIVSLALNEVPHPVTHDVCLQLGIERFGITTEKSHDVHRLESVTGPFGSACFRQRKDLICVWYCTRPAGLILGALACPSTLAKSPDFAITRAQCSRMIGSALFNRAEWGAADPLTSFVTTEILELDPPEENPGEPAPPRPASEKPSPSSSPRAGGTGRRQK